jgi:flavin reductase (DIM6/NTAB) family NADH-FMN oxidoreductase RutF
VIDNDPLDGRAGAAEHPLVATDEFRSVMTRLARPVSVVTCAFDGQPYGATVSAFGSQSMDPPLMLVSLNQRSRLFHVISQARRFRINILAAGQQEVAARFASKLRPDRFIGRGWKYDDGLPLLIDAQAWITCVLAQVTDGGDHAILLGYPTHAAGQSKPPLVHCAGTYGTYAPGGRERVLGNSSDALRACGSQIGNAGVTVHRHE